MAIWNNFPWVDSHNLNLSYILKQIKDFKAQLEEFETEYEDLLSLAQLFSVDGSNVTLAGQFQANALRGNLTGNVAGNVTGNVNGNASSATNATNATNASHAVSADASSYANNAGKSDESKTLTSTQILTVDANKALPLDGTTDYIPDVFTVYSGNYMSNVPSGLTTSGVIIKTTWIKRATVEGVTRDIFLQELTSDKNSKVYHRLVKCEPNTHACIFENWNEIVVSDADHATTADSATSATSATTADSATSATNATNANTANVAYRIPSFPKLGSSNLNYTTTSLNTVSFEFCTGNAQNIPTSFRSGAIVLVTKFNQSGNTYISQYAFNRAYLSGGGDGNAIAMRYGFATGEDKDPQDDEFTWSVWKYLVGGSRS